jgi:uncharacterized protein YecE (DUF72 family)
VVGGLTKALSIWEQQSAVSNQHSVRAAAWCCFDRHLSQQGCSYGDQNLEPQRTQRSTEEEGVQHWRKTLKTIYIYFDNDQAGYAPQNALALKKMIRE